MSIRAASSSLASNSRLRAGVSRVVSVLVVGGGGGGGFQGGGGGGGGWQEQQLVCQLNTNYSVSIGGGGAASSALDTRAGLGSPSTFGGIISVGGGFGGTRSISSGTNQRDGMGWAGGSGGGAYSTLLAGATVGQGNSGATGFSANYSGGGGGAAAAGSAGVSNRGGAGGAGKSATLTTGSTYAGGGGGGTAIGSTAAVGGSGGGGNSGTATSTAGVAGAVNTGGGGGGGGNSGTGGAGGSGVVVLRFSAALGITLSAGLTSSITFVGGDEIVTITAGTGTVTFF